MGGAADSTTTGAAGARLDCCLIEWEAEGGHAEPEPEGGAAGLAGAGLALVLSMLLVLG